MTDKQTWYFIFGENSVFKKRYIKYIGTKDACSRNLTAWKLENLVVAILLESDFKNGSYSDYKEIEVEGD